MSVDHETLVHLAKTFGLVLMMSFFIVAIVLAYLPGRRAAHDRAARSILPDEGEREDAS